MAKNFVSEFYKTSNKETQKLKATKLNKVLYNLNTFLYNLNHLTWTMDNF